MPARTRHTPDRARCRPLWPLWALALLAMIPVFTFGPQRLGSGHRCNGIGFGCDLESQFDTALVAGAYLLALMSGALAVKLSALKGKRRLTAALLGVGLAMGVGAVAWWSQLPRYEVAEEPVDRAVAELGRLLDGAAADAPPGDFTAAAAALSRTDPVACSDAMDRPTGGWRVDWRVDSGRADTDLRDLDAVVAYLRDEGFTIRREAPTPDDNRFFADRDGVRMEVIARAYASLFELRASSTCMRPTEAPNRPRAAYASSGPVGKVAASQ